MGCYFSVLGVGILKGICSSKDARKLGEREEKLEIGDNNIWLIPTPGIDLTPTPPRARITATANQLHIKSGLQVVRTRQDAKKTEKKGEKTGKKKKGAQKRERHRPNTNCLRLFPQLKMTRGTTKKCTHQDA